MMPFCSRVRIKLLKKRDSKCPPPNHFGRNT